MGPKKKQKKSPPALIGPDGENKCHVACGQICLKLPATILTQLTANPLNRLKLLEITSDLKKVHIKVLFKSLGYATGLEEVHLDGDHWSGNFSEVADEMAAVLSRCTKFKMKNFKESGEFWQKCTTAAASKCKELVLVDCNGLDVVLSLLHGLLPRLSILEVASPYLEDEEYERAKQQFCIFFQQKISQPSKLSILRLDNLWSLMDDVPHATLSAALGTLSSLSLCRTSINPPQLVSLLKSWAMFAPACLSVESDWGFWNQAPSKLLLPAITRISTLKLKGTKLGPKVMQGLLSGVAGGCAVKVLDVRGNDMSQVSKEVLVAAVARLRVAVFTQCGLVKEAVVGVLEALAEGEKGELEELDMTRVHPAFEKMNKEDKLVKWANEGAGLGRLKIHSKQCKCDGYCSWY